MWLFLRGAAVLIVMGAIQPFAVGQLIIGHRGASHDAPENTLSSFRLALEQGADGFETDFWLSSDHHIVCFHDKDTKRIAGRKLVITKTPFDKLEALDVGSWKGARWKGERMPKIEDVLATVPAGKRAYLELKSGPEIVGPLAKALSASPLSPEQTVIISFHADAVAEAKKQLPHVKVYWLCNYKKQKDGSYKPTVDEVIDTLRRTKADALDSEAVPENVDEKFIERLRAAGFREFHVWTVDDPQVAQFYKKLGVASITTNRPGWLREQLGKTSGK